MNAFILRFYHLLLTVASDDAIKVNRVRHISRQGVHNGEAEIKNFEKYDFFTEDSSTWQGACMHLPVCMVQTCVMGICQAWGILLTSFSQSIQQI